MAKKAEKVDPILQAACEQHDVDPASVLDWRAYDDRVVFVVADGRKLQVERGKPE